MKILKQNWGRVAMAASGTMAVLMILNSEMLWGQSAPGLRIAMTSNIVSLTVTNGASNGLYQIYFTEFLDPNNVDWTLLTNGATGQTNFSAFMGDLEQGFFKAVNNNSFTPPAITVIIQSPANGAVLQ